METCENCGRAIGKLETPHLHGEHVVCLECKQRLSAPVESISAPPPLEYARPRQVEYAPPQSDINVWINLKWLGLIMFGFGAVMELNGVRACGYIGLIGLVLWLIAGVVSMSKK